MKHFYRNLDQQFSNSDVCLIMHSRINIKTPFNIILFPLYNKITLLRICYHSILIITA